MGLSTTALIITLALFASACGNLAHREEADTRSHAVAPPDNDLVSKYGPNVEQAAAQAELDGTNLPLVQMDPPPASGDMKCSSLNPTHSQHQVSTLTLSALGVLSYNSGSREDVGFGPGWRAKFEQHATFINDAGGTRVKINRGHDSYIIPVEGYYHGSFPYWPSRPAGFIAVINGDNLIVEGGTASTVSTYEISFGSDGKPHTGRLVKFKRPYNVVSYDYDSDGLLIGIRNSNSCVAATAFTRDRAGKLINIVETDPTGAKTVYNLSYTPDGWIKAIATSTLEGVVTYSYEYHHGKVVSFTTEIRGTGDVGQAASASVTTVTYAYDNADRLISTQADSMGPTTVVYSDSQATVSSQSMATVVYGFDRCRISSIDVGGKRVFSATIASKPFDLSGHMIAFSDTETNEGGVTTHRSFLEQDLLLSSVSQKTDNKQKTEAYLYNSFGQPRQILTSWSNGDNQRTVQFYDQARRLRLAFGPNGVLWRSYNSEGRVVTEFTRSSYVSKEFDERGLLTKLTDNYSKQSVIFTYNEACQLTSRETRSSTITFGYTPLGLLKSFMTWSLSGGKRSVVLNSNSAQISIGSHTYDISSASAEGTGSGNDGYGGGSGMDIYDGNTESSGYGY